MWRPLARAHTAILGRYTEHVWYNLLKRNSMYDVNVSDNTERKESYI